MKYINKTFKTPTAVGIDHCAPKPLKAPNIHSSRKPVLWARRPQCEHRKEGSHHMGVHLPCPALGGQSCLSVGSCATKSDKPRSSNIALYCTCYRNSHVYFEIIKGSLEVKLPTIWRVQKAEQRSRDRR